MPAVAACAATGVYKPRRPHASPLFRLVSDHFRAFHTAYEERFAETYGDWRPATPSNRCRAGEAQRGKPSRLSAGRFIPLLDRNIRH